MMCPVHNAIATHQEYGQPFCLRCFWEAVDVVSPTTVTALVAKLMAERKRRQEADLRAVQRRLNGRRAA